MSNHDQQLIAAGMDYLAQLASDQPPSIPAFVAAANPVLRDELPAYLELMLAAGAHEHVASPTADERAMAERAAARAQQRFLTRASASRPRTLSEARTMQRLSLGVVARQINLPPDLLARIERGGVTVATIPARLVARLATTLNRAEDEIHALLGAPTLAAPTALNAVDGTVVRPERVISFADALRASAATREQRNEWSI